MQKIDRSYRRSLHTVLSNHIPQDIIDNGNEKKTWKYGFNKEYDVVIISKDGTIGEVIGIEGLAIALPSVPKKIRFDERPEKDQKWARYKIPAELVYFDSMYKDEPNPDNKWREIEKKHAKFIDDDFKRKFDGNWFMNEGIPTYITGFYYFFLQHYKLTDMRRYGDFRVPQRDYFIFVEACFADDRSVGVMNLKSRRMSFSTSSGSIVDCKAVTIKDGFFPIVSKKDKDASTLFERHIVKPFLALPKYLQPQRVGEVSPKKELYFSAPKRKLTTNNKADLSSDGLDTLITFYGTTEDSYDGTQVTISINDEIGKFRNIDLSIYWEQHHKMTHIVGGKVVGKALCGSTANAPNKGGKEFQKFYENSKITNRDRSGMTNTGLYSIFVPADLTMYGFFDEYGHSIYENPLEPIKNELGDVITTGAKDWLDDKEFACGNDIGKLNRQKRNYPRVDRDAFLDEDATNTYATTGIVNHIDFLKDFQKTTKFKTNVFRFDLYYKPTINNPLNVEMKRSEQGRFVASWLPPMELRNKFRMKDGKRYPVNESLGSLGNDPYQADRTKYGGGSKMGMVGITTNNQHNLVSWERNKTFVFYNFRPDTVEDAETDAIKLMLYLSMPILIESNKDGFVKRLYRDKLSGYSIKDPTKDKKADYSDSVKKYGGIYTSPATRAKEEESLETYLQDNVHDSVNEDDIKVPFLDLNIMATEYTDSTRTKLDGVVAWQLACLAVSKVNEKFTKIDSEQIDQKTFAEQFQDNNNHVRIIDLFKRQVV